MFVRMMQLQLSSATRNLYSKIYKLCIAQMVIVCRKLHIHAGWKISIGQKVFHLFICQCAEAT